MQERLLTLKTDETTLHAVKALESGQVIYFPELTFAVRDHEKILLNPAILHPKHKNISFDPTRKKIAGLQEKAHIALAMAFMDRFAHHAKLLIDETLPEYTPHLIWGRTSFRPAEVKNRVTSKRKDDTRIHVDAFPSTPVNGLRILRVFCNINPSLPRTWELGESFEAVMQRFVKTVPRYRRWHARLQHLFRITKTLRSPYDHFMLYLHDHMKLSDTYQQTLTKDRVDLKANSTWIVFTDQVSHAALGGQYLLEQTFYLPVDAMQNPALSPQKCLEPYL